MSAEKNPLHLIRTFNQLVKYLKDELDWPIETDDFEELTFDYAPEELGLDVETAVKIKEIKQLRPLTSKQPWGIFFVNFAPKQLPVVALRRILSSLVIKKRQSANKSQQAAWRLHDLLFISSYGESEHRDITFAHFAEEQGTGDLPTLRLLGWDDEDTKLKLDFVERELNIKLRWPKDEGDITAWRARWSSAFRLRPREVIRTSQQLAIRLADLARGIRKRANNVLAVESDKGPLRKMHAAFKEALIHDLSTDDFADMYAQTISYGLLTARISRPAALVADNLSDMVPVTNPFLKDMLETFLRVGGRKAKIDFDELGVNEVVQLLRDADMEAVLRDFGDRNPQEDPVIHFYELFLKEYDPDKRAKRGVFYTPRPVVSYIVRSVHELLQKEFDLEDGLASTVTWGEMAAKCNGLAMPAGTKASDPFVVILDPATGTGTFLVEAIEVIHNALTAKWERQRLTDSQKKVAWNDYVPKHLLPRIHGYELLMAPYAIAHMKIGLTLYETGYRFGSSERARIYLTNSLEPPNSDKGQMSFSEWMPALAHEAQEVNTVKRDQRFTVVIGNPPYASISSNLTPQLRKIVDPYRFVDGEKIRERSMLQFEKNIQDDYIKFLAFSQATLRKTGKGICAMITNHSYLDGPTLRGVRWNLAEQFARSWFVDLHGNSNKQEAPPEGQQNENVFDIKQGVSIIALVNGILSPKTPERKLAEVWGTRSEKYGFLSTSTLTGTSFANIDLKPPYFYFVFPDEGEGAEEWNRWPSIADVFTKRSTGTETGFDDLLVGFTAGEVRDGLALFSDQSTPRSKVAQTYDIGKGHAAELFLRRSEIRTASNREVKPFQLRAYDYRFAFLRKSLLKTNSFNVMLDLANDAPGLVTTRQTKEAFAAFAVGSFCGHKITSSYDRSYIFPIFTGAQDSLLSTKSPCVSEDILEHFRTLNDGRADDIQLTTGIFHFALAVMNSPTYPVLFNSQLKRDWPRLPLPMSWELFRSLFRLGGELASVQLLESPKLDRSCVTYIGSSKPIVDTVSRSSNVVWLDGERTRGFRGVPESVWEFHIGGYQVCEKWLKDRKGRTLSKDDIAHYNKIVAALSETIHLMKKIDEVIDEHGGWPGAFVTDKL